MTHISPLQRHDLKDLSRALRHRRLVTQIRNAIIQITCAIGLVILAAAAGYLLHEPTTCADPTGRLITFD